MRPNKFVIEKQVSGFRSDNGLSLSEPIALKSLLLKLNILTIFRPLSENFSGMCLKDKSGHRFMLVNSNQSQGRQHFTIAHELGHWLLHKDRRDEYELKLSRPNGGEDDPMEKEANTFAAELLVPFKELLEYKKKGVSNKELAKMFFVSERVIEHRLEDCIG